MSPVFKSYQGIDGIASINTPVSRTIQTKHKYHCLLQTVQNQSNLLPSVINCWPFSPYSHSIVCKLRHRRSAWMSKKGKRGDGQARQWPSDGGDGPKNLSSFPYLLPRLCDSFQSNSSF